MPELKKILKSGEKALIFIDGTHIRILRPTDDDKQKAHYSGKKKFHSKNVLLVTIESGMIIGMSKPFEGKTHDMKVLQKDFPKFGKWLESMKNPDTPESEKITACSDTGFIGIKKYFPGIISVQPEKKPRGGELTKEQKASNKEISKKRIRVEHPISHMKNYAALGGVFRGTEEYLYTVLCIASGIVNLRIMFRDMDMWRHMNEMAARTGARQIPLPSAELIKKAQDAEAIAGPKRKQHKEQMIQWRDTIKIAREAKAARAAQEKQISAGLAALWHVR